MDIIKFEESMLRSFRIVMKHKEKKRSKTLKNSVVPMKLFDIVIYENWDATL